MSDLTNFLLARIAEDEAVAKCRHGDDCPNREHSYAPGLTDCNEMCSDPRRWLAECEAKRRIVELHETVVNHGKPDACGVCTQWDDYPWRVQCGRDPFPCDTLRALATVYADHPDYRDEWRS